MHYQRPERKRIRLQGYDYSQCGYYFVTICTKDRMNYFGEIRSGIMGLNEIGNVAAKCWQGIPDHFPNVRLDEWVVMPDHLHGVLEIMDKSVGGQNVGGAETHVPVGVQNGNCGEIVGSADLRSLQRTKMLLPKIIHGYKSSVTRYIRREFKNYQFGWQHAYYDHIIRNDKSLNNIREYIQNNPSQWKSDDLN